MANLDSVVFVVVLGLFIVKSHQLLEPQKIDTSCNPSLNTRMHDCPSGYCCVRDEYLPTYTYCQRMGLKGQDCTTRVTESNCPCVDGYFCHPNIHSATFLSLYGKCFLNSTTGVVG